MFNVFIYFIYLFFNKIIGPTGHVRVFILLITNNNYLQLCN